MPIRFLFVFLSLFSLINIGIGQETIPVYIDAEGVMRWSETNEEAAFFGTNYTVPFAYGYRSHKALGLDLKKSIKQDVYHLSRLGLDAFRVHVWDTEISDTLGNLLNNEHLDLFDYLLAELKKKNIKTIVTPIAYWGNGYPQQNEDTPGFSNKYGKGRANREPEAIKAQVNFVKQFFEHKNPYTTLRYQDDEDIIAMEINNEPSHGGSKESITAYINTMFDAVRSTGWNKPIFYNISQNPWCADAVAKSKVQGFAFQWYPTGLVANKTLKGNYLHNVDNYVVPFDTLEGFKNKALMVYEFDAADILKSCMYPMMVRSFRESGFQWATQFAYDPMATAYGNTEYQTHFVNLAFSPGKAISLMIASEVFHKTPRLQQFYDYPLDTTFGDFTVSYERDLSLMNSDEKFYYSNDTKDLPKDEDRLKNIAGVGSSTLVKYEGSGAYFLDKIEAGVWRLEVMPDAVLTDDPFGRASPKKEVSRVVWNENEMEINLKDLGLEFHLKAIKNTNNKIFKANAGVVKVLPGIYLLFEKSEKEGTVVSDEYVSPPSSFSNDFKIYHEPPTEAYEGSKLILSCQITENDSRGNLYLQLNSGPWQSRRVDFTQVGTCTYQAEVDAEKLNPGQFQYRIVYQKDENFVVYPGGVASNPLRWDNYQRENYNIYVAPKESQIFLFDAKRDRNNAVAYNKNWRENRMIYTPSIDRNNMAYSLSLKNDIEENALGFQNYFKETISAAGDLSDYKYIKILVANKSTHKIKLNLKLIDGLSNAFGSEVVVAQKENHDVYTINLGDLQNQNALSLPRPYPGFQELTHKTLPDAVLNVNNIEKLEVLLESDVNLGSYRSMIDIISISLSK